MTSEKELVPKAEIWVFQPMWLRDEEFRETGSQSHVDAVSFASAASFSFHSYNDNNIIIIINIRL